MPETSSTPLFIAAANMNPIEKTLLKEGNWSNEHFWIKTEVVVGSVADYSTQDVPVISGSVHTNADSSIAYHGTRHLEVSTTNTIRTEIRNTTTFWLQTGCSQDIHIMSPQRLAVANRHEMRLLHTVYGAEPRLAQRRCDYFILQNRSTGMVLASLGSFNPETKELRLEELYSDMNDFWKRLNKDIFLVIGEAEKTYVKSTLNRALSPTQRVVDLCYGCFLLMAFGGWIYSPALSIGGVIGAVFAYKSSRSLAANMPAMRSWIASKLAFVAPLQNILESSFARPESRPLRSEA